MYTAYEALCEIDDIDIKSKQLVNICFDCWLFNEDCWLLMWSINVQVGYILKSLFHSLVRK